MIETRELPAPTETVSPIKPSEALRLGRLTRPMQCAGKSFLGENAACALGAIALGLGYAGQLDDDGGYESPYQFIVDNSPIRFTWESGPGETSLGDIYMMNDRAVRLGQDGDAAVLAYLEERGL